MHFKEGLSIIFSSIIISLVTLAVASYILINCGGGGVSIDEGDVDLLMDLNRVIREVALRYPDNLTIFIHQLNISLYRYNSIYIVGYGFRYGSDGHKYLYVVYRIDGRRFVYVTRIY